VPPHSFNERVSAAITRLCHRVRTDLATATDDSATTAHGLLVGLSGGPDSVALLLIAHEWAQTSGSPVAAAHLNHRLRGHDADNDQQFCRELCARLDLPLHLRRADPRPVARQRRLGLEEAGRVLRRRFFADLLAADHQLLCVATGHHRDDQAETVVMRLFRGTGLDGLRGIRPVNDRTIHPLLEFGRTEIVSYLEQCGQPYRLDVTNETGDNTRSRVRRELLPLVRDIFGHGAAEAPARLAGLIEDDADWLDATAHDRLAALSTDGALAVDALCALPAAVACRVVRLLYANALATENRAVADETSDGAHVGPVDLQRNHVTGLLDWLATGQSGQTLDLPHGLQAVREFDRLHLRRRENESATVSSAASYRILVEPAPSPSDPAPESSDTGTAESPADTAGPWRLRCPAIALQGRLRVRAWRPGDRIELPGLGGHKKVSDLLQEQRVPASERPGILVVEDDGGLLWVVGHACAARAQLLPTPVPTVIIAVVARASTASSSHVDRAATEPISTVKRIESRDES